MHRLNADVLAGTAVAAADTGSVSTAAGSDITTGDGNVGSIVITLSIVISAAADTGTIIAAACTSVPVASVPDFSLPLSFKSSLMVRVPVPFTSVFSITGVF